jgi:hypothetical protein
MQKHAPKAAAEKALGIEQRQAAFRALVDAQDGGMTPEASRKQTAARFNISESSVRKIEEEGLAAEWPPL